MMSASTTRAAERLERATGGDAPPVLMAPRTIESLDGTKIAAFRSELVAGKPMLTVVLPFGLRAAAGARLWASLLPRFNIITWEARSIIDPRASPEDEVVLTPQMHVRDMEAVVAHFGIGATDVIGFCSGAGIALLAASEGDALVRRLALVCGEYVLPWQLCPPTPFQRGMDWVLPQAALGRDKARSLCQSLVEGKGRRESEFDDDMALPFANPEYLYRHGVNYAAYRRTDFRTVANAVSRRAVLISTTEDKQVNALSSRLIAEAMADRATHLVVPGDHYELLRGRGALLETLFNFLGETSAAAGDCRTR